MIKRSTVTAINLIRTMSSPMAHNFRLYPVRSLGLVRAVIMIINIISYYYSLWHGGTENGLCGVAGINCDV